MNRQHGTPKKSAFSLIELLVTVTIITLLCAILLPSIRTAKGFAHEIYCQSNLAQQAKAWMMYLDAHNGYFYQNINANIQYGGWVGEKKEDEDIFISRPLNPFLGLPGILEDASQAQIFRCPSDDGDVCSTSLTAFSYFGTSYQMNILLADQNQIQYNKRGRLAPLCEAINLYHLRNMNVSRAAEPSKLFLMGDYGWINRWTPGPFQVTEWHNAPNCHNMAFLDGHVKFTKIRKGLFVTSEYRVLPFDALDELALRLQVEEP